MDLDAAAIVMTLSTKAQARFKRDWEANKAAREFGGHGRTERGITDEQ